MLHYITQRRFRISAALRRRPGTIDDIVLTIVRQSDGPIGAYQIAEESAERGSRVDPVVVYRCLPRLIERGLVHRVVSRKGFIAAPDKPEIHIMCENCSGFSSVPADTLAPLVEEHAAKKGFKLSSSHYEVLGNCRECPYRRTS